MIYGFIRSGADEDRYQDAQLNRYLDEHYPDEDYYPKTQYDTTKDEEFDKSLDDWREKYYGEQNRQ